MSKKNSKRKESQLKLKKAVTDFISESKGVFDLNDVLKGLPKEFSNMPEGDLLDEIEFMVGNIDLAVPFRNDFKNPTFINIANLINGGHFCISPTESEIEKGILIPGHRFFPFIDQKKFPHEVILTSMDFDGQINKVEHSATVSDLQIYYSIMNFNDFMNSLVYDKEKNEKALKISSVRKELPECLLTVFDMKGYYKKYNFKKGDALFVTVDDYEKALCSFRFLPGTEKQKRLAEIKTWVSMLEDSLLEGFEENGSYLHAMEQLENAIIKNPELLKQPYVSIGEFLRISQKIELTAIDSSHSLFWHKGADPKEALPFKDDGMPGFSASSGEIGSINDIMDDLGIFLLDHEIEAYMRDELFNGGDSLESVKRRCFKDDDIDFVDDAQEITFENCIEEIWEDISTSYDKSADEVAGRLRSQALEAFDKQREWISSMDESSTSPEDIPEKDLERLSDATTNLSEMLMKLNKPEFLDEDDADNIENSIEMLSRTIGKLIEEINAKLGKS